MKQLLLRKGSEGARDSLVGAGARGRDLELSFLTPGDENPKPENSWVPAPGDEIQAELSDARGGEMHCNASTLTAAGGDGTVPSSAA
eukprot:CAMPEP_0182868776 /NCGR_PEP_ID=MMETSP0034_2-20130328/9522_1 /TAXON_ID=156128 /ORGANISM="Nephroselmis pyriformis, Strain CCMP717" /LENGTH=86 /DNA_ID=CAMNT_0025001193 /DNA_START=1 /DNA_END=260 /DNA_ORIENTATION=-